MSIYNNDWWDYLKHSGKGSTWENHKYVRKEGDRYIYEEDLKKEKMLNDNLSDKDKKISNNSPFIEKKSKRDSQSTNKKSENSDIEEMAKKVIRGEFGNGEKRKKLLGDKYAEIQKRVNELMKSEKKSSETFTKKGKDYVNRKRKSNKKK